MRPNKLYIWTAQGNLASDIIRTHAPGQLLVKIGVTTTARKKCRIAEVAKQYGFDARILVNVTRTDASLVETTLLRIGRPARGLAGDGRTEFRFMSPTELKDAIRIATPAESSQSNQSLSRSRARVIWQPEKDITPQPETPVTNKETPEPARPVGIGTVMSNMVESFVYIALFVGIVTIVVRVISG